MSEKEGEHKWETLYYDEKTHSSWVPIIITEICRACLKYRKVEYTDIAVENKSICHDVTVNS